MASGGDIRIRRCAGGIDVAYKVMGDGRSISSMYLDSYRISTCLTTCPSTATRSTTWLVSRVSSPSTSAAPDFPTDRSDSAASPTEWMTSGRSWTQQASSAPRSSASQRVVPSRSFSRRRIPTA